MKCNHIDCNNRAGWQAGFKLFAATSDVPAIVELGLYVCTEHKEKMKVSDLVTDEGWDRLCESFSGAGKTLPVRSRTALHWKGIS